MTRCRYLYISSIRYGRCIIRLNTVYGLAIIRPSSYSVLFQLPSHSNLLTPYSIFAYTLVIFRASAKLQSLDKQSKELRQQAESSNPKVRDRPHNVLLEDRWHNIALTLPQARHGAVVCACTSVSVHTRTSNGVHHNIDSLLARAHTSQVVRRRGFDEAAAAALASRAIDRQCLERGKVRRVRARCVAGVGVGCAATTRLGGRRRRWGR